MTRHIAVGTRYGRLVVVSETYQQPDGKRMRRVFIAKCDCGTELAVRLISLTTGHTKSCGCLHSDVLARSNSSIKTTHGHRRQGGTSSEYHSWQAMLTRCYRPNHHNYPDYGGRGISVYPEWCESFEAFLAYMGPKPTPKHTIDRFPNNNGNYEPGNVRWATMTEQAHNKRPMRPRKKTELQDAA